MGVHQARIRAAARQAPEGGGITAPSLTDTATDDDVMEHETGENAAGFMGAVDLDWDQNYGDYGVATDLPPADPLTVEEARDVSGDFVEPFLPTAQKTYATADEWRANTVSVLPGTTEPVLLAGADPLRKQITVKNMGVSAAGSVLACDVYVGVRSVLNVGGAGAFLLRGGYVDFPNRIANVTGDQIVLTHTEEVWFVPALYAGVTQEAVLVTYSIERYTK